MSGVIRATSRVVQAAVDAGHDPDVVHEGKRFRLVCSCGFRTPINMTRKTAFRTISEHVYEMGHAALQAAGQVPDTPPTERLPETVRAVG